MAKKFLARINQILTHLVFPDDIKCMFCGRDISDFYNKPYCDDCEKVLAFNNKHRCKICDTPLESEADVCDICQKNHRNFVKAFCPFVYSGKVRSAVLNFKDKNQRYKAKAFAIMIVKALGELKVDWITFVPMTEKKTKKRSFNQSKLLAEEIAKILNVKVVDLFEKVRDDSTAQKFLSFEERQKNIVGMYKLKPISLDKNLKILIVDDVITTGATVDWCSKLLKNKVKSVYACAIARTKFEMQ